MSSVQAPERSGGQNSGTVTVEIADADFVIREAVFDDPKITGAQVAEAAGAHPVEEFVVLKQLPSRELETLRPTELVTVAPGTRFFVIRGDSTYRFLIDGLSMEWPHGEISGRALRKLIGFEDDDAEVVLERSNEPDAVIDDDDAVPIGNPGVERFRTRPAPRVVSIEVDGEPYHPAKRMMSPDEIVRELAHKDPATHYLVQIRKDRRISYEGEGGNPIRLRDGMCFQVISTGPTPVSDPLMPTGAKVFMDGLRALGYDPASLPDLRDHVVFDYEVPTGKFAGRKIRLGLVIPPDFPMTPPSGPYVTPEVHPIKTDGPHPLGAVHKEQARVFDQKTGLSWQYWSRPFREWGSSKQTVATYMSHVWKLWDSQ